MKNRKFLSILIMVLILVPGCAPNAAVSRSYQTQQSIVDAHGYPVSTTNTPMPSKPQDYPAPNNSATTPSLDPPTTFTLEPSPTITSTPKGFPTKPYPTATLDAGIMPGPVRSPNLVLPGNLQREEYPMQKDSLYSAVYMQIIARHPESGNAIFLPKEIQFGPSSSGFKDGTFEVLYENSKTNKVTLKWPGHNDFEIDCPELLVYPVHSFVYTGDHWYLSSSCPDNYDIFSDGVSINQTKGYTKSTAFQLLDGQPLYLYEKDGMVGVSYNGIDTALDYDQLAINLQASACEGCFPTPHHFEHMITFAAIKGDQLYYVAIGHFKN